MDGHGDDRQDQELNANRDTVLARLLNYYQMTQPSELYADVGQGAIRLDNIREIVFPKRGWKSYIPFLGKNDKMSAAKPLNDTPAASNDKEKEKPKKKVPHAVVLTDDELGKKFVLSNCCHPIPGDEVLGYMDEKGLLHIHKIDCPEANLLKPSYGKQSFVETIELKGIDKFGVFIHVLQTITTDFHINIRSINISSEDGIFKGTMEVYVYDRKELDDLLKALRKIEDIKDVKRINELGN